MPIDAPVVMRLSNELNNLLPLKVDKIHQPYFDEFILNCFGSGENYKILISLNQRYARFHFFQGVKENPANPSSFCMLLRKHFSGSKLVKIEAIPFERICKFIFEVYDQLFGLTKKHIWLELTGRSSNLIITDEKDIIIDLWKKKHSGESQSRDLSNGMKYEPPSAGGRWQPVTLNFLQFKSLINEIPGEITLEKVFFKHWYGLSALAINEITRSAGFDPNTPCSNITGSGLIKLHESFINWANSIAEGDFEPSCIYDGSGKPIDFSAFNINFPPDNTIVKKVPSLNQIVDEIMDIKHENERLKEHKLILLRKIQAQIEKARTKLAKQEQEASIAEKGDSFRIMGEHLITYGHKITKGNNQVKLQNLYDSNESDLIINLNPALSAQENAQIYFKKYQKAKKGQLIIAQQLNKTKETLDYLESLETMIFNALTPTDVKLVEEEFSQINKKPSSFPNNHAEARQNRGRTALKKGLPVLPREFKTSTGQIILVGRNNFQNDYLTFKIATPNDLWFHTQNIPGSHVILKSNPGVPPDDESLFIACQLAAFFSKARQSTKIPVDYTQRKNVKKPPGSKPGFVIYDFFKTIIIDPDYEFLNKLGLV